MIINCHTRIFEVTQFSNGTDFTLPGSTADRYTYAYSYDSFGRLTESARYAGFSVNPNNIFTEKNLTYDRNGNILTLTRYGNGNATIKDNFIYSYSGNQIEKLEGTHNGSGITHTVQSSPVSGTADYQYDGNGNMTLDALRNIFLTYDINNLVSTVSRNDTLLSTYHYLADGTKYKVIDPDNNGRVYIGPFSYTTAKSGNTVYSYLEGIDTDGGRIMIVRKQSGTQNTYDYTTAFFVRDHLGSTRVMLNSQGDILERNAYYPFGLQMNQGKAYPTLTQRLPQLYSGYVSSTPARRDLYNGKEIQTAAGTDYLDYGFRQYDQTIARWFNIDPKAEKYASLTPYNYCSGNSINCIDNEGKLILFINGYYNTGDIFISRKIIGQKGGEGYWGKAFIYSAMNYFSDNNVDYIDGRGKYNSSGTERFNAGYLYAKNNFDKILSRLGEDECVNIVSHSMGGAYAEGIVKYLQEQNIKIGEVIHFSPADPGDFTAHADETYQLNIQNDIVLAYKNFGESNIIGNVKRFGNVMTPNSLLDDIRNSHSKTKASSDVWKMLEDLKNIQIQYKNSYSLYYSIPTVSGFSSLSNKLTFDSYSFSGNKNGYIFNTITINGQSFNYSNGEYLR